VGADFNVNFSAAVVWQEMTIPDNTRDEDRVEMHAVREFTGLRDTPHMIQTLQSHYSPGTLARMSFYPDASGGARKTVDATKTDLSLLRDAGFRVRSGRHNPRVKERVLTARGMILNAYGERHLRVNPKRCPELADAFESIGWDAVNNRLEKSNDEHDLSHVIDAGTYPIWHRSPRNRQFFEQISFSL
jgi:hypothetical protein